MFWPGLITPASDALFAFLAEAERGNHIARDRILTREPGEVDDLRSRRECENYIAAAIKRGDVPQKGARNQHATRYYIGLYCRNASPEVAEEHYARFYTEGGGDRPDADDTKIAGLLARIWDGKLKTNPQGSELQPLATEVHDDIVAAVIAATNMMDPTPLLRQKYMPQFNDPDAPLAYTSTDWNYYLGTQAPPPTRLDLIPGWVASRCFIPLVGVGGRHKSRLAIQIQMCKLTDRELFMERELTEGVNQFRLGGPRPCGGLEVSAVEMLSYEEPEEDFHRRVNAMARHFGPIPEGKSARRIATEEPIIEVIPQKSGGFVIDLTRFGTAMVGQWEAMRGHKVILLDSFFDAVRIPGIARMDDDVARRVVGRLNKWCEQLDATILGPFHQSASGVQRSGMGYAQGYHDKSKQALMTSDAKGQKAGDPRGPIFVFNIMKWNAGPQGRSCPFWYENGQLVTGSEQQLAA